MPNPTTTISTRANRIGRIADAYISISGDDPQDFVTDLLTDLQHWCAANRVRFGASLMRAQGHFTVERIEEARRS